jgi:hypothetical protein
VINQVGRDGRGSKYPSKEMRNAYTIFVKDLRVELRRRWEDRFKMILKKILFGDIDVIHLDQDGFHWLALVNTVMDLRVPLKVRNLIS